MTLDERITFNANQCGGRACIREMRIRVADILEMLAQGVTEQTILADFPDLEAEDIRACLHFGAQRSGIARLAEGQTAVQKASAGNMKRTWVRGAAGALPSVGEVLREAAQVKHVWVPYGA